VNFVVGRSDARLQVLAATPVDLFLIDGGHGYPLPQLDWFYGAHRLRAGGVLVLDDMQLWAPYQLDNFLLLDPRWEDSCARRNGRRTSASRTARLPKITIRSLFSRSSVKSRCPDGSGFTPLFRAVSLRTSRVQCARCYAGVRARRARAATRTTPLSHREVATMQRACGDAPTDTRGAP
jgi:hypothetical protein